MKKKLVVILAVVLMVLSSTVAMARYSVVHSMVVGLTVSSSGFASGSAECDTQRTADIAITVELQQYNGGWKTIHTESGSENADEFKVSISRYVVKGYSYRIKATFDVDDGNNQETLVRYSSVEDY